MKLFGLIGYPLSHSFSKRYFEEKFRKENIHDVSFELFSISTIQQLFEVLKIPELCGLSVTFPYKKAVIDFLDEFSIEVNSIRACNCIKIVNGKLIGYNTDIIGFENSFIQKLDSNHTKALVLGTGGAAQAVEYILKRINIPYKMVSRTPTKDMISYNALNESVLSEHTVLINTTPLGTFPNIETTPDIPYHLLTPKHYLFDLVYNPAETKFLQLGKKNGATTQNGYDMLVIQAEENWRIWND